MADITKGHRRILALDGLRGIAALSIYIYHVDVVRHRGGPFSHGYLAVDFFFLLSGFVIGEAYELRMASGLPTLDYMRLRLIRLYPMIAMGAALGLIIGFFRFHFNIWLSFVAQLAFIPFVVGIEAYPLNGVQWSLLFELIANCVHAIARRFLSTRNLAGFVILAAPGLAATDIHYGNLNVGFTPENFWGGFARVGFSFGAGLLIYRQYAAGRPSPTECALPRSCPRSGRGFRVAGGLSGFTRLVFCDRPVPVDNDRSDSFACTLTSTIANDISRQSVISSLRNPSPPVKWGRSSDSHLPDAAGPGDCLALGHSRGSSDGLVSGRLLRHPCKEGPRGNMEVRWYQAPTSSPPRAAAQNLTESANHAGQGITAR